MQEINGQEAQLFAPAVAPSHREPLSRLTPSPSVIFRGSSPRMLAICSEPGFCQDLVLADILDSAARQGLRVLRHDLTGRDAGSASTLMVRASRHACGLRCEAVVGFDSVPPSDESCVRRQARALRRMWEAGISVVFTICPEGMQLLESLPECRIITSRDLLVASVVAAQRGDSEYRRRELTWGVPSLVRPLLNPDGSWRDLSSPPREYFDALASLVLGFLRPTLSDEELRLRLSIVLLGNGTADDLLHVLGSGPCELLQHLRDITPIVEVSSALDRFRCLTDSVPGGLRACLPALALTCSAFDDVAPACISLLLNRGEMKKAALLFELPQTGAAYPAALVNAPMLLDVGCVSVLVGAVDDIPSASLIPSRRRAALRLALESFDEGGRETVDRCDDVAVGASGHARDLLLFADARRFLRAEPPLVAFSDSGWTNLGRRLLAHREACDLLARGRTSAAMRVLVANPAEGAGESVSASLLCLDFEAARLLLGDSAGGSPEEVEASLALLSSGDAQGMRGYADCLGILRAVLSGAAEPAELAGRLISRSERSGDTLLQALALLAGCVADIRCGACARANVRAMLALAVSGGASLEYVSRLADLLGRVSRHLLGERPTAGRRRGPGDDLDAVACLVDEAILPEEDAVLAGGEVGERVPREALWLLYVLERGMGGLSQRLWELTPESWRQSMLVARACWEGNSGSGGVAVTQEGARALLTEGRGPDARPIEVRLLGEFELRVGDVTILDGSLEHRNAKPMLEYLILQRGASAKRYQLVEQVWPECDYATGFSRIYQATSVLRSAIGAVRPGLDPFVIGRSTKVISLNRDLVGCDVDEFRACAREAADGTSNERVLEMARRAEKLYGGDLYMPSVDATGFVSARREELRALYADAMVAGADAAIKLGRSRTAVRMANNALSIDDMREDAVTALVRSLRASGRNAEAELQYRSYAGRLYQQAGRPPSKQLRRAMGERGERRRSAVVSDAVTA